MNEQKTEFNITTPLPPENAFLPHTLALTGQRFKTHLLDFIFTLIFGLVLGIILTLLHSTELLHEINNNVLGIVILFLYYFPQEALFGKTLGKRIIGTQVLNADGSTLSAKRALYRTLCRLIPFDALSFLDGDRPRGWHDTISKTIVISIKESNSSTS